MFSLKSASIRGLFGVVLDKPELCDSAFLSNQISASYTSSKYLEGQCQI